MPTFNIYQPRVGPPTPPRIRTTVSAESEQYRAISQFGQTVGDIGARVLGKIVQNERSKEVNGALTEARKRYGEWYMQRETDDNYLTFGDQFEEFDAKLRDELMGGLKMPGSRNLFDQNYDNLKNQYDLRTKQLVRDKSIRAGQVQLQSDLEQMIKESDEEGINTRLDWAIKDDVLDPVSAAKVREEAVSKSRINAATLAGRAQGYEEAIMYFATPEAGTDFNLKDEERYKVISKLQTEWGILQRKKKVAGEQEMWDAYKAIRGDELTELEDLDQYENLDGGSKIRLGQYMAARQAELANEAAQIRDREMNVALSDIWTRVYNELETGAKDPELDDKVQEFLAAYPDMEGEIQDILGELADRVDEEEVTQSKLTIQASNMYATRDVKSLTDMIGAVASAYPDEEWTGKWVEHWTMRRDQLMGQVEQDQKRAKDLNVWNQSDPMMEVFYLQKLTDPTEDVESIRAWIEKYWGPDIEGNPQISNKQKEDWWFEVEKWKNDPAHITAALSGLGKQYDEMIRAAKTPEEAGELAEQKVNTLRAFREEALKNDYGATELESAKKTLETELSQASAEKGVVGFLRAIGIQRAGLTPEELMVQWAEAGMLDDYGRLVGRSEEEQLEALGIESFADLDWSKYPRGKTKMEKSGIDPEQIRTAPPAVDPTSVLDIYYNLEDHEVLTQNEVGEFVIFNRLNGTRYPADVRRRPIRVPSDPIYEAQEPEPVYANPRLRRGR